MIDMIQKMELREFLKNISNEGNHRIGYHILMDEVRKYEQKYGIQIKIDVK